MDGHRLLPYGRLSGYLVHTWLGFGEDLSGLDTVAPRGRLERRGWYVLDIGLKTAVEPEVEARHEDGRFHHQLILRPSGDRALFLARNQDVVDAVRNALEGDLSAELQPVRIDINRLVEILTAPDQSAKQVGAPEPADSQDPNPQRSANYVLTSVVANVPVELDLKTIHLYGSRLETVSIFRDNRHGFDCTKCGFRVASHEAELLMLTADGRVGFFRRLRTDSTNPGGGDQLALIEEALGFVKENGLFLAPVVT